MFVLDFKNEKVSFFGEPKTPMDFVSVGVVLCLGHEILENRSQEKFKIVKVCFSNKKLKIICSCNEKHKEDFLKIFSDCYVLKNLTLEKEIIFDFVDF